MWRILTCRSLRGNPTARRHFASEKRLTRVAVVGACGHLGSTLALLLKQSSLVEMLVMCDVSAYNCGVAMDVSHIDTPTRMSSCTGLTQFPVAFKDCDVVLVCAGEPRSSCKMSPQELFAINAPIVQHITECFAENCPHAFLGIITQPISSLVPMASEILKQRNVYDHRKVFGVTCVDVMRATTFASELDGVVEPEDMVVPVVGGHCEKTIVPVVSQAKPCEVARLGKEQKKTVNRLTRKSAGWVIAMKDDQGTAVLAPAYAIARFTNLLIKALKGEPNVNTCAYVSTDAVAGLRYCSLPVEIGPQGVTKTSLPSMTANEQLAFATAKCELKSQIELGEKYIHRAVGSASQKDLLFDRKDVVKNPTRKI